MAGEDGAGQVLEPLEAGLAPVTFETGLGVVPAVLDGRARGAVGADHAVGPSHVPGRPVARGVVEEVLGCSPSSDAPDAERRSRSCRSGARWTGTIVATWSSLRTTTPESIMSL